MDFRCGFHANLSAGTRSRTLFVVAASSRNSLSIGSTIGVIFLSPCSDQYSLVMLTHVPSPNSTTHRLSPVARTAPLDRLPDRQRTYHDVAPTPSRRPAHLRHAPSASGPASYTCRSWDPTRVHSWNRCGRLRRLH